MLLRKWRGAPGAVLVGTGRSDRDGWCRTTGRDDGPGGQAPCGTGTDSPAGAGVLLSATDTTGRPLYVSDITAAAVPRLLGAPVYVSRGVGDNTTPPQVGYAGDWSYAVYGTVEGVQVSTSDQATLVDGAADGDFEVVAEPVSTAAAIIAVMDGLQIQWLYEPDSVDMAEITCRVINALVRPAVPLVPRNSAAAPPPA